MSGLDVVAILTIITSAGTGAALKLLLDGWVQARRARRQAARDPVTEVEALLKSRIFLLGVVATVRGDAAEKGIPLAVLDMDTDPYVRWLNRPID